MDTEYFNKRKAIAKEKYDAKKSIHNPYLDSEVTLNSDGFHHLQFSARRERNKKEQLLKFSLLPLALTVIKKSSTLQEYRKVLSPVGKTSKRDGSTSMKEIEYWGFIAIINEVKVKVILRRVGDGNFTFWSVMPYSKLKNNTKQKLFSGDLVED